MFEQIGTRSWDELKELLDKGYLAFGKRRVTRESAPNAMIPDYRLWEDWNRRENLVGASAISG